VLGIVSHFNHFLRKKDEFLIMVLAISAILISSCSFRREKGQDLEPLAGETWFAHIERTIIKPKCLSCHMGTGSAMGIDLSSYNKIMATTVIRFKPEQSKLFTTVQSGSMPKNGDRLPDSQIQRIYEWIQKGAPEGNTLEPEPPPQPEPLPSPTPLFSWIDKNIFQPKCLECHKPPRPKGDVDLSSYRKLMESEGIIKTPIVPGNPEESGICDQVLIKKMPPDPAPKLSQSEERAIYDWIKDGAKDN